MNINEEGPEMARMHVAIRVRPFNYSEREAKEACCVRFDGNTMVLSHPETKATKMFTFNHSYWSHDGFREGPNGELIGTEPGYASQQTVCDTLTARTLDLCLTGHNSTVFTFGAAGSGKSYSLIGYGVNRGLVPLLSEQLFRRIEAKRASAAGTTFEVSLSMLELYNERAFDLLAAASASPGSARVPLRMRAKPSSGSGSAVYAENQRTVKVESADQLATLLDRGLSNRTIAAVSANTTSSRGHTFIVIEVRQREGNGRSTSARMTFADLAAVSTTTHSSGDRLAESAAINDSLLSFKNVIYALSERAMGKRKVFVPYRNSLLTRMLEDSLECKEHTTMLCTLSPAARDYDATLEVLRSSYRAHSLKRKKVRKAKRVRQPAAASLEEKRPPRQGEAQGKGQGDGQDRAEQSEGQSTGEASSSLLQPAGAERRQAQGGRGKPVSDNGAQRLTMSEYVSELRRCVFELDEIRRLIDRIRQTEAPGKS